MTNAFDDLPPISQQPATPEVPAGANAFADLPPVSQQGMKEEPHKAPVTAADRVQAGEAGILKGFAYLGGMIPDVVPNAKNLGVSLYDIGAHYLGGKDWADLPRPGEVSPVGGAIAHLMDKSPITTTQVARPDDPASRYLAAAGGVVPALAAGGASLPATASAAARAVPIAVGGQAIADTGHPYAAIVAQALAGYGTAKAPGAATAKGAVIEAGQDLNLRTSPATTNPTSTNRLLETLGGGKQKIHQLNSVENEGTVNGIVREEIGLDPTKTDAITDAEIAQAKAQAQVGRDALRGAGQIKTPPNFDATITALQQRNQGAARVVPGLKDNKVNSLLNGMKGQKSFDAADGVDAVAGLREKANQAYRAGDTGAGAAYKGAADALEDAFEQHLSRPGAPAGSSDLLANYRASRQTFAKIYTVDDLRDKQGNVTGAALSKSDAPLTGKLKTVADTASQDPKSFSKTDNSPGVHGLGKYGSIIALAEGARQGSEMFPHSPVLGALGGAVVGGGVIPATGAAARALAGIPSLGIQRTRQLDLARILSNYTAQNKINPPTTGP